MYLLYYLYHKCHLKWVIVCCVMSHGYKQIKVWNKSFSLAYNFNVLWISAYLLALEYILFQVFVYDCIQNKNQFYSMSSLIGLRKWSECTAGDVHLSVHLSVCLFLNIEIILRQTWNCLWKKFKHVYIHHTFNKVFDITLIFHCFQYNWSVIDKVFVIYKLHTPECIFTSLKNIGFICDCDLCIDCLIISFDFWFWYRLMTLYNIASDSQCLWFLHHSRNNKIFWC